MNEFATDEYTYSRLKRPREQSYILIIYVPILFKLVVESRFAVDLVQTDVIAANFFSFSIYNKSSVCSMKLLMNLRGNKQKEGEEKKAKERENFPIVN